MLWNSSGEVKAHLMKPQVRCWSSTTYHTNLLAAPPSYKNVYTLLWTKVSDLSHSQASWGWGVGEKLKSGLLRQMTFQVWDFGLKLFW